MEDQNKLKIQERNFGILVVVLFIAAMLYGLLTKANVCTFFGLCLDFGAGIGFVLFEILMFFVLFAIGFYIGFKVLIYLFDHDNVYLIVGIFLVLVSFGFMILAAVNSNSVSDVWGYVGIGIFIGIVGFAMIIFPLIWPEKYGIKQKKH